MGVRLTLAECCGMTLCQKLVFTLQEGPRAYSGEVSCQTDKLERDAEATKGSTTAESQTDKLTTSKRDAEEALKDGKGVFEGTC